MAGKNIVLEALKELTGGKVDDATLKYMAGMLEEEGTKSLSAESAFDLVGLFLLDSECAVNDDEAIKLCDELASKLNLLNDESDDKPSSTQGDDQSCGGKLSKPVVLGDLMSSVQSGYNDPFLGLKQIDVNFNSSVSIGESMKLQKAMQREREKQLRLMKEWERQKAPLPPPRKKHGDKQLGKVTDVVVDSFSVAVGGRELLKDAALKLVIGRKYGLIGRNGIGKSTFLGALARHEISGVRADISIGCVEQEVTWGDETALNAVLSVDVERTELMEEEKTIEKREQTEQVGKRLAWVYQRLQDIDASNAGSQAATILSGLGFSEDMQHKQVKQLSGGWRMRVALARALFADPDIMLLDEPTNHLDLHAVAWLSEYLQCWNKTAIIVSHARHFLNDVCTDMIHFADQTLVYYRCNYDQFEVARAERQLQQQRQFDAQEAKKKHMQQFIDRFRYNASRAALVQSRLKALSKLPMLEAVSMDPTLTFDFGEPEDLPTPMLQLKSACFTYDDTKTCKIPNWILKDVNMSIDLSSRVAVCGVNGSGKSTLLRLLTGQSEPSEGDCVRHNKLRIGFFSQHHVDQLDLTLNSVQQLQCRFPEADLTDEAARNYLGRFGISGLLALEPLYILSGGQKSRVAISLIAFKDPHILILDEPTNHLDLDAVQALIAALNSFSGGVVVVSHDAHLLSFVVEEVWHVEPKDMTCVKFHGDFEAYRKQLLNSKV